MWTAMPLSQLGTWDGNCIYKIQGGSRRCKMSAGGDTNRRRFGNRSELIAKTIGGVSLTKQEESELARGLCCLNYHSTKDIAQEICEDWARVPATVLMTLPSQQSEMQMPKVGDEKLSTELKYAKAMKKHYYESWVNDFYRIKILNAEIGHSKTREETRQVEKVSKDGNQFLTTKFGTAVSCSSQVLTNCLICRQGNI